MRFLLILGGVVGLLLAAAFLGPMLYDWNRFKPEIEAKLAEALGREVRIEGPVSLSLIPGPRFSAADLTISNLAGGSDPVMARVRLLRLNLVPLRLLTGAIQVDSLVLDRPAILLEQVAGKPNWVFGADPAPGAPAAGRAVRPPAVDREEKAASFGLDRVLIREGALIWRRAEGAEIRLQHLGADVKAGGLSGPFEAKGSLVVGNAPVAFTAASGAFAPDRGTPLALEVKLQRADANLRFTGMLSNLSSGKAVRGKLQATAQRLDETLREIGVTAQLPPPAQAKAVLEGEVQGNEKEIAVNALALRIGDTVANGALTVLPEDGPQIDLAVALPNLNLDKWLATAAPVASKGGSVPAPKPAPAPAPPSSAGAAPPLQFGLKLPAGIDATVDLSAEGVVWRNQAFRQVSLHLGLQNGRLQVHQGLALLPAGSELRFNGIFEDPALPVGKGAVEMRSDNLRGLLSWLGMTMPEVPADRLRRFVLASGWEVSGDLLSFGNVDAALDTSRLSGSATMRFGARPSYALDAAIDNVNIDAYFGAAEQPSPQASPQPGPPPAQPSQQRAGAPQAAPAAIPFLAGLADFDAEIKLAARQVLWGANVASGVAIDGTLSRGRLTLRDASIADLAGGSVSLSGGLDGLAGMPRLDGVKFDIAARQPARLMRVFGLEGIDWGRVGQMELKGAMSGALDKLALETSLDAGGGTLSGKGEIVGLPVDPAGELAVTLDHPSFVRLAGLFGDYRPSGAFGPVALKGTLIADDSRLSLSDLDGQVGEMALGGSLMVDWTARPRLEAALTAGDIPLDDFLPAKSSAALPRRNPGVAPVAMVRPIATGTPASGGPPWSANPVDLSALTEFDAKLAVTAKSLSWDDTVFDQPVVTMALEGGRATLEKFESGLYGGQFGLSGAMDVGSPIRLDAKLALSDAEVREAMKGGGGIAVTAGKMDGAAEIATSGISTQEWASRLSGQGRFAVRDGVVAGFDLPEINRRLNNIENVTGLLGLLQAGLSGGQTKFTSLAGTFQAQHGILTSDDLRLDADGGRADGKVRIDLPRYLLDAKAGIRVGAASDAPPLGLRLEGPLDAPRKFIDINELQAHLLAKGMGRLLRGRTEAPKEAPPAAAPAPDQGAENPKPPAGRSPEDLVRELLKGLGR